MKKKTLSTPKLVAWKIIMSEFFICAHVIRKMSGTSKPRSCHRVELSFFCEVRISPNFRKDLHALSPLQMFLFQIASLWTLFLSLLNLRVLIFKWKLVSCSAWTVDYGLNIWYLWSVRCRIVYGWNSWKLNWSLFNRVDFLLGIEIKLKNCI